MLCPVHLHGQDMVGHWTRPAMVDEAIVGGQSVGGKKNRLFIEDLYIALERSAQV